MHSLQVDQIKRIAVAGSGAMGSQIAMVCALAGYDVTLQDINGESLVKARRALEEQMRRRVQKGRLTQDRVDRAFARLRFEHSLAEAVKQADFVIEAIVEKLEAKRALFAEADRLAPPQAVIASNSSTIVSSKLADATRRPDKVCNLHFFNPALVMELVEVVKGPHTSEHTAQVAVALARRVNKVPILLKKEISGFVANRLLAKLTDEAIYLLEEGIATAEEIDLACTKGLNHPIGPFALMDMVGIDVHYDVRMQRYRESGDENAKPSKTVAAMVERGQLGRKTGKGFYDYSNNE